MGMSVTLVHCSKELLPLGFWFPASSKLHSTCATSHGSPDVRHLSQSPRITQGNSLSSMLAHGLIACVSQGVDEKRRLPFPTGMITNRQVNPWGCTSTCSQRTQGPQCPSVQSLQDHRGFCYMSSKSGPEETKAKLKVKI